MNVVLLVCAIVAVTGGLLAVTLRKSALNWPGPKSRGDTSLGRNSVNWLMAFAAGAALVIGLWWR